MHQRRSTRRSTFSHSSASHRRQKSELYSYPAQQQHKMRAVTRASSSATMAKKSETVAADSRATAVAGTKTPASVKEEKKEYDMPSADDCPIFLRSEYLFSILCVICLVRIYLNPACTSGRR